MMPMSPMDWSVTMMRAGSQMMGVQIRLAQVVCEAGLQQQQRLWGLRAPVYSSRGTATGACGPISGGGRAAAHPRLGARLRAVPASPGALKRRGVASTAPQPMPVLVARSGDAELPADL